MGNAPYVGSSSLQDIETSQTVVFGATSLSGSEMPSGRSAQTSQVSTTTEGQNSLNFSATGTTSLVSSSSRSTSSSDSSASQSIDNFVRDIFDSKTLDLRVRDLAQSLQKQREHEVKLNSASKVTKTRTQPIHHNSDTLDDFYPEGTVSMDNSDWCSPRMKQVLADLEALEAYGSSSKSLNGTLPQSDGVSPRLRQLREISCAVRGSFWEDQMKRSLLFLLLRRRWATGIKTLQPMQNSHEGKSNETIPSLNLFRKSPMNHLEAQGFPSFDPSNLFFNPCTHPMAWGNCSNFSGSSLSPYVKMCVQTVMHLATMHLSQMAASSPIQALEFVKMIKMQIQMLWQCTNMRGGLKQGAILAGTNNSQQNEIFAMCDQAFQSIGSALSRVATSVDKSLSSKGSSKDPARECTQESVIRAQLRNSAAEIVIELALGRRRLSGLTEALTMLIELSRRKDSSCELLFDSSCLEFESLNLSAALAVPESPPAGLGMINKFTVAKPSNAGMVRSQRSSSPSCTVESEASPRNTSDNQQTALTARDVFLRSGRISISDRLDGARVASSISNQQNLDSTTSTQHPMQNTSFDQISPNTMRETTNVSTSAIQTRQRRSSSELSSTEEKHSAKSFNVTFRPPKTITLGKSFVLHFQCENDTNPGEEDWIGLYKHRDQSLIGTNVEAVGDRFYKATVERQRLGILWESDCGPMSPGWYEFRYYCGSGTQKLACVSEPVRVVRKFASIASDGKNLFIYNEEGLHRIGSGLDQSARGKICATSPLIFSHQKDGSIQRIFDPPEIQRKTSFQDVGEHEESSMIQKLLVDTSHRMNMQQDNDKVPGWIAYCQGKIYIRSPEVVGAAACIDPESLDVEGIITSMGGGIPEQGAKYLTPAIFREQVSSCSPMFTDGRFLFFARFEGALDTFGSEKNTMCHASLSENESKYQTLSCETKRGEQHSSHNRSPNPESWTLENSSIGCCVDIVDPTREGSPLLRRILLKSYKSSARIGSQINNTSVVDNNGLWNGNLSVTFSSLLNAEPSPNKECGPNMICSGSKCCFKNDGYVKSWTVRTTQAGRIILTVWRKIARNRFKKIGQNVLLCGSSGLQTLRVAVEHQIRVLRGDFIGAVASQILCCAAQESNSLNDENIQVAYGNTVDPQSIENSQQQSSIASESIVDFQKFHEPVCLAIAANPSYDTENKAHLTPWKLPCEVDLTKIGPENCTCYTNGDELCIMLDYSKLGRLQYVEDCQYSKRYFIFSTHDGRLVSEASFQCSHSQKSKMPSLPPFSERKEIDCLSTCYDSTAGCLWTCAFDTSQVMQYAACAHLPSHKGQFVKTENALPARHSEHEYEKEPLSPADAARRLVRIMARRAQQVSPSEVHVQSCAKARSRRIVEREKFIKKSKQEQKFHLHVGQSVTARYGPGWFLGEISHVNADGTYGILYADGDRRSAVRPESIKVVQSDGSEIVATKWKPSPPFSDPMNQSIVRSDEQMLSQSSWSIPADNSLFVPLCVEMNTESFVGLHDLLLLLVKISRKHAEDGIFQSSGAEELIVGVLVLLRVNAQRLLLADVGCKMFEQTKVWKQGETVPILKSLRDVLHHIFTGSWLAGTASLGTCAQSAASAALTDGLDLWFTDPKQQIELLHTILETQKDGVSSVSSTYDSLLCQFAREEAATKLVRTAIGFIPILTEQQNSNSLGTLACNTGHEWQNTRTRLTSDSNFEFIFTQLAEAARQEAVSALVKVQEDKTAETKSSESTPVLKLLSSLQLEVLMLVSEKQIDIETMSGEKLLMKHAAIMLSSTVEVMNKILGYDEIMSKCRSGYTWKQFSASVRCALDRTFVGNLLPVLCSVVVSLLLPLHNVPEKLLNLQSSLGGNNPKKWCINLSNVEWIKQMLPLAKSALSCFDKVDGKWKALHRIHCESSILACKSTPVNEMAFEILHTEPKLQFVRRQLCSLVGSLSGALFRVVPESVLLDDNSNGLSKIASQWICKAISHVRGEDTEYKKSETEEKFLKNIVSASGDMAKAARHLAWKARSPKRQSYMGSNDLSVDGSVAGHLQELARSASHKIRRNLAVKVHSVNEAERAVAAAMIHHCGLTSLAQLYSSEFEKASTLPLGSSSDEDGGLSSFENVKEGCESNTLSKGFSGQETEQEIPKPPSNLIHLWKQARRARKWLKQQKDKVSYSGGVAAYDTLATQVRNRAMFLLELQPMHTYLSASQKGESGPPSPRILEAVLNFATSPITSKDIKKLRDIVTSASAIYSARQLGIESASIILEKQTNPDTLLHVFIPILESVRHLPSTMAISGMLVQDAKVETALEHFLKVIANRLVQSSKLASPDEDVNFVHASSSHHSHAQQWRSFLYAMMDLTVNLSPLLKPETILQSKMLACLISTATQEYNYGRHIDKDLKNESKSRLHESLDSPERVVTNKTANPILKDTDVQEVDVHPDISVSSINFAHSQDPSVLLQPGGYWQSEGNLPHWIELRVPESINLCTLRILLMNSDSDEVSAGPMASRIDHSFCPRVLSIFVGTSSGYLQELRSVEVGMTTDWITLVDTTASNTNSDLSAALLAEVSVIRLEIAHNHMSGQNSRLAQIQISALTAKPSQASLITCMKLLRQRLTLCCMRVVLDNVLNKLEKSYRATVKDHHSLDIPESILTSLRETLSHFFNQIVLHSSYMGSDPEVSKHVFDRICNGLLPLIVHAKTSAVQNFFEIPDMFAQLVRLSQSGPSTSRILALRLLRQLLPAKSPSKWNKILVLNKYDKQSSRPKTICHNDGLLGILLESIGFSVISNVNAVAGEYETTEDDVMSETLVLIRTLSNSENWLPTMKNIFRKIIMQTLRLSDINNRNLMGNGLLGLCAAVFSILGGYKDTLRVGGFATWSENYKARRQDSSSSSISSSIDNFEPLLLVMNIQKKESHKKFLHKDETSETSATISSPRTGAASIARVKIVQGMYRNEYRNVARDSLDQTLQGSDPITVNCNELLAVSEILQNPETLVDLDEPQSDLIELLNILLSPRQPEFCTNASFTGWQELKTVALKASTQLLRNRKICTIFAKHPTFFHNLLSIATHPAAEVAAITEAAEGIDALDLQSRKIQALRKAKNKSPVMTFVRFNFQKHKPEAFESLSQSTRDNFARNSRYENCCVHFEPGTGKEIKLSADVLHIRNGKNAEQCFSDKDSRSESEDKTDMIESEPSICGELVTTSELYSYSSNDCGGRTVLLVDYSEINELELHADAKSANALIIVEPVSKRANADNRISLLSREVSDSVSNFLPSVDIIVSISSDSLRILDSLLHTKTQDTKSWRDSIEVGDQVDAIFWPTGLWLRTTVVDMDHRYVPARRFIKLTYNGLTENYDIWSSRDALSIAPAGTRTVFARHGFNRGAAINYLKDWRGSLAAGSLVDAKDTMGNWYKSKIIDVKGEEVKIHYQGWKPRWDIWMNRTSDDLAPLCTKTRPWRDFKIGDIVDANPHTRDDHTAWTEGVVVSIECAPKSSSDSLQIYGFAESTNAEDRVLIRFPSLNSEQWFASNSEELCVPGTHVTSKRKEKLNKTVLPPAVRKSVMPQLRSSFSQLQQFGFSGSLCKRATTYSQGDLPAAAAWLFEHADTSSKENSAFLHKVANLKTVEGGVKIICGARQCEGGVDTYHTAKLSLPSASSTTALWLMADGESCLFHEKDELGCIESSGNNMKRISTVTSDLTESNLSNLNRSISKNYSYVLIKGRCAFHGISVNSKVRVKYGKNWYDGKIRKVNADGTCAVVYSDGDVKMSVPEHDIKLQRASCNPFQMYVNEFGHLEISLCTHHAESRGCEYNILTSSRKFQHKTWTHVSLSVRASELDDLHGYLLPGVVKLHINGVLDNQVEIYGKLLESDWPICIGGSETDCGLKCTISNLKIYSRCLSTAEVIVNMKEGGSLGEKSKTQEHSALEFDNYSYQISDSQQSAVSGLANVTLRVLSASERGSKEDDVEVKVQVCSENLTNTENNLIAGIRANSNTPNLSSISDEEFERDELEHMQSMRAQIRNLSNKDLEELGHQSRDRYLARKASHEINKSLQQKILFATSLAKKCNLVVDISELANRCNNSTYVEEPCAPQHLFKCSRKILCKGAAVKGRVGSRWYTGRIHAINNNGTLDIAFDDNDFRPNMPSQRVQILVQQADRCLKQWVLASEVQKLSVPELQSKCILKRKSAKELYRMTMSTELLLQTIYARYSVTALIRGWPIAEATGSNTNAINITNKLSDIECKGPARYQHRQQWINCLCKYLRMLSTHEFTLASKRRLMSWSERFQECGTFSGLASGVKNVDSCGGCSVTGTWLDSIRSQIFHSVEKEIQGIDDGMAVTEMLLSECVGNLVQLAWSQQPLDTKSKVNDKTYTPEMKQSLSTSRSGAAQILSNGRQPSEASSVRSSIQDSRTSQSSTRQSTPSTADQIRMRGSSSLSRFANLTTAGVTTSSTTSALASTSTLSSMRDSSSPISSLSSLRPRLPRHIMQIEQQILEARNQASRLDIFRSTTRGRGRLGLRRQNSGGSSPVASASTPGRHYPSTSQHTNLEVINCVTSSSSVVSSDEQVCGGRAVWLHGDGNENRMLNGPNMLLSAWIIDIIFCILEGTMDSDIKLNPKTLLCLKRYFFNHRVMKVLIASVHHCKPGDMSRLLPLLSRFLRIIGSYNLCNQTLLGAGFDVKQFSTLAEVASQRYSKEQLCMVKPSTGGVPIFSLYCQQLIELMIDVKRTSIHTERCDTRESMSHTQKKIFEKPDTNSTGKTEAGSEYEGICVEGESKIATHKKRRESSSYKNSSPNVTVSSIKSLKRRMQWCGLDLGDSLSACLEVQELDDTILTLWLTKNKNESWKGSGIQKDLIRVVEMMSSRLLSKPAISSSLLQPSDLIDAKKERVSKTNSTTGQKKNHEIIRETISQIRWSHELDLEFVALINNTAQVNRKPCCHVLLEEIIRSEIDGVPSWLDSSPNLSKYLSNREDRHWIIIALQVRLEMLRRFNRLLSKVLPLVDLRPASAALTSIISKNGIDMDSSNLLGLSLGERIVCFRGLIFLDVKRSFFNRVMTATTSAQSSSDSLHGGSSTVQLKLNRWISNVVPSESNSIFMQAFRQLGSLGHKELSSRARPWNVVFEGEAAEDAGGPFRSSLMFLCDDLTSEKSGLNLMIPTRNTQLKVGENRGKFTLAPGLPFHAINHLTFLGKLLGVGMRQQISCPLNMCRIFWKHFTGEGLDARDIRIVDDNLMAVIEGISQSEDACDVSDLTWSSFLSSGDTVELRDRSPASMLPSATRFIETDKIQESPAMPLENRIEALTYAKRLYKLRSRESTFAIALVMRGMRSVIPVDICRLFTCEQLESEICGVADMDVDLLARNTTFEIGDASFQKMFWKVLKSYNSREQSQFLRFVWARDRLPTKEKFEQKLRIGKLEYNLICHEWLFLNFC